MRYSLVAAAVLLGSGLAAPHNKEHDQYDSKLQPCKRHDKDCELSFKGTAYPVAISGTPIGPGGPVVTGSQILDEARYYTTEHYFVTSTIKSEDHGSSASPSETPPDMPPPVANKHAVSNGNTEGSRNGDQCKAATVTVTNQITSTVTVAPGATPASSVNASPSNVNVASGKLVTNEGPDAPETEGKSEDTSSQPSASSSPSQSASPETGGDNSDNKPSSPSSSSAASSSPSDTTKPTTNDAPAQAGLPFRTKRGVICSGDTTNQLAGALAEGKISWSGNWYSYPQPTLPKSITYVPQMYGKDSDDKGEWTRNTAKDIAERNSKYFLSFGEPGTPNPVHHATPDEAVAVWREKLEPFAKKGITLGAPGTLQNTQDFAWLEEFLQKCTGCTIGFLAQHWFDKATDPMGKVKGFKETLNKAKALGEKYKIPGGVWLDNFEADGSAADQKTFLKEVVPWLDSQDWIKAYAYVPPDVGKSGAGSNFIDAGANELNDLGKFYANL